jgi:hypothetical protein
MNARNKGNGRSKQAKKYKNNDEQARRNGNLDDDEMKVKSHYLEGM